MGTHGYLTLCTLICATLTVAAQNKEAVSNCPQPTAQEIFHANDIRTVMSNTGNLFQKEYDNLFQVPFAGPETPNALFAGGLWLGGWDESGNLKMAAQTFRGTEHFDYGAGPLATYGGGTNNDTCSNWDKIWFVNRNEVLLHIEDLADNGNIDDTIASIFAWPGHGNTSFETFNGFPMVDLEEFGAPFEDQNGNGIYEPNLGEYPHLEESHAGPTPQPMLIAWTVYNDNSNIHTITQGDPLRFEVQLTMYAFSCEEGLLNESLFTSYKIVNRSIVRADSIFLGQWLDPDLGCPSDDAFGSYPDGNTFFVYNQDMLDGGENGECGTINTYDQNPPALAVTFLNRDMASFTYYNVCSTGNPPVATCPPVVGIPLTFYRHLTGSWNDGTPISSGGSGYQIPPVNPTKFAFPGDPNDPDSWSMVNEDIETEDRRIVGSTELGRLNPGEAVTVDLAFTYHNDHERSNLGNVSLMFERIAQLQEMYDRGFATDCSYLSWPCQEDCIYPGDTDQDGKVTGMDYINTALGQNATGPVRKGPIAFLPLQGDDWDEMTQDSINYKHVDCDGNGKNGYSDFAIIDLHYGNQTDWYTPTEQEFGDEIEIVPDRTQMVVGENFFEVKINFNAPEVDSLYGLVFSFEYDPQYFDAVIPSLYRPVFDGGLVNKYSEPGRDDYILVATDLQDRPVEGTLMAEYTFFGSDDFDFTPPEDTTYFRITDVKAVLADGTILDLHGQEVPLYLVEELTATNAPAPQGFRIFPNPSSGSVTIENKSLPTGTPYRVYTSIGQYMYYGQLNTELSNVNLPSGLYYFVIGDDEVVTEKVVVLK